RAESVILKSNLPLIEFVNCVRNRQSIESNHLKNKQPWKNAATGAMVSACKNKEWTGKRLVASPVPLRRASGTPGACVPLGIYSVVKEHPGFAWAKPPT